MRLGIGKDGDENVLRRGDNKQSVGRENIISLDEMKAAGVEPCEGPAVYREEDVGVPPDGRMLRTLYEIAQQNPRALCVLLMRSVGRESRRAIADNLRTHGKEPDLKAVVRAERWLRQRYPALAATMK